MTKKFEWGKVNKCGVIGCNKQINWGEFTSYLACEKHHNLRWGLCEACQKEKTTHSVYYDIYHGNDNAERALKEVNEGVGFQKEIIAQFFSRNISGSLREKLNAAYQKAQVAEKIIPELERLTREYWEKKLNCASNFIGEKGGQQINIYESNLCDNCGDEINARRQKLNDDYQRNVLDKLIAFGPEVAAQIEKEIGRDGAQKIIFDLAFRSDKVENRQALIRYRFLDKLPFFQSKKSAEQNQKKKEFFQKLRQYFQGQSIKQIIESGGDNYIIYYANGNIEEKSSSQLAKWGKLRTFFFNSSQRCLSLHEINGILASLEQEPSPQEKETPLNRDGEKKEEKKLLSDSELELIKSYFRQNKIKQISFHNGELVITYNDNKIISSTNNNFEYQLIKDSLSKIDKNELTAQELGLNSENISPDNASTGNKYYWLIGGVALGIIIVGISVFIWRQKKSKNK
ncbi:protein of unknown function [endosymbiont DhMRE of Dentiscutata heterogama]|uniref:hypothetical protein n=1 Tax=endosymbiont DhMRE of Dentiscutata heterogama TaxID=1609546 RepID=UPI000629D7E9|nr:hypothetical protein [endosymbiont DhMRE of Dentiscutata heterogama]CFW93108.1 protein of unknown function [endosymbiont DhMRE of Dentiscutata heterogama]